jgi:hypothetical protein
MVNNMSEFTDEQRWQWFKKYWDALTADVYKYEDGSFTFSHLKLPYTDGGKDLESFVDRMMRKEKNV